MAFGGFNTPLVSVDMNKFNAYQAEQEAQSLQRQQEEQVRYDPWSRYRPQFGDKLAEMMSGGDFQKDPSYQFRVQQGQQALERSLAAKGLLNSGNAAVELLNYGQQAASQEFQAQFARLAQLAGINLDPTAGRRLQLQGYGIDVTANQAAQAARLARDQFTFGKEQAAQEEAGMQQAYELYGAMLNPQAQSAQADNTYADLSNLLSKFSSSSTSASNAFRPSTVSGPTQWVGTPEEVMGRNMGYIGVTG